MTSCVIWGKSLNSCVPHSPHLSGGGNSTFHLPTSQGCCEDPCGNIQPFQLLGRGAAPTHFILYCTSFAARFGGKGTPCPGKHSHPQKLKEMKNTKGTMRTLSSSLPERSLESHLVLRERSFTSHQQRQSSILLRLCRQVFLSLPEHTLEDSPLSTPGCSVGCIYLEGIKLRKIVGVVEVEGKVCIACLGDCSFVCLLRANLVRYKREVRRWCFPHQSSCGRCVVWLVCTFGVFSLAPEKVRLWTDLIVLKGLLVLHCIHCPFLQSS